MCSGGQQIHTLQQNREKKIPHQVSFGGRTAGIPERAHERGICDVYRDSSEETESRELWNGQLLLRISPRIESCH